MQNLVRSKTLGVTGNGARGTAGAGPGRDLLYHRAEVVEEAVKMALEHRVNGHPTKIASGNKWFRLWKKRQPEYTSRTPQLVESDRADARLTRAGVVDKIRLPEQ